MLVAGTRPEVIKLASVIQALQDSNMDYIFVWSGQHYDYEMSKIFFEQLGLTDPAIDLNVRSGSHAEQTAKAMLGLEKIMIELKPSLVMAVGDTNTVLATALSAAKTNVPFAHIEAGVRSWDRTMPEEINRIVADSVASILFAPSNYAVINLMHEGKLLKNIYKVGDTAIDTVNKYRGLLRKEGRSLLEELNLNPHEYFLVTIHRQENTDNIENIKNILSAINELSNYYRVVFPMHPRTKKRIKEYHLMDKLSFNKNIILLDPLGYFQFLGLLMYSLTVLTDSGGVQKEALALSIPTVTLRYTTEWIETVILGINSLAGANTKEIIDITLNKAKHYCDIRENVSSYVNKLKSINAGKNIAKILKAILNDSTINPKVDLRKCPYITYAIVDFSEKYLNYCLSLYNENFLATSDIKKAQKMLIKIPYTHILREDPTGKNSNRNITL